jgi:hypothetical protein
MPMLVRDLAGASRQETLTRECEIGHVRAVRRAALRQRKKLNFT